MKRILFLLSLSCFSLFSQLRLNSGGAAFTDALGNAWLADQYFTGGAVSTGPVPAGAPGYFLSKRYGDFTYSLPVPDGAYTVGLSFLENVALAVGGRVFNVTINGAPVLTSYDIVADVGLNVTTRKTFPATAAGKGIVIKFATVTRSALINAIDVTPVPAPPAWFPTLATFANPPASPAPGQGFLFTDASATVSCTGGGASSQPCYWTGSGWAAVYPTDPSIFPVPPLVLHGNQCLSGLVDVSAVNSNGPVNSWEVPIITSMDGSTRYLHVAVSEHTRFLGLPDLCAGMGRPGTNDTELTGICSPLEVSDADAAPWFTRPIPPQITGGYPLVVVMKSSGGTLDGLTQGSLYWEICGFAVSPPPASSQLASLQTCAGSGPGWDCTSPSPLYAATIRRPDGSILPIVGPSMPIVAPAIGFWLPVK